MHFPDILPIIYRSLIVEKYEESGPLRPGPSQTKPKSVNLRAPQSTQIRVDDLQTLECLCAVRPFTHLTINFDPMNLDHVCVLGDEFMGGVSRRIRSCGATACPSCRTKPQTSRAGW